MPHHIPVMLTEVLAVLAPVAAGGVIIDGTTGGGGHAKALLAAGATRVLGLDWDAAAIETMAATGIPGWEGFVAPYDEIPGVLAMAGVAQVQGVLLDLGLSSNQLDDPTRGLSYQADGPLDMRLNSAIKLTAADIINSWREADIADVLYQYGEEPKSRVLARAIVSQRKTAPFETTGQLLRVIEQVYPARPGLKRSHPAARIFQALRVTVNDELAVLERAIPRAAAALAPGGRLAIITFQTLEERVVKAAYRALAVDSLDSIGRVVAPSPYKIWQKQLPTAAEITANPRSRSAVLRVIERVV
jgi:16S rRNA (cytosine1402-N4)-methyltransferase